MKTELPKIALGAWSWGAGAAGGEQVFGNHLSEKDLQPVFEKAMECGLTLWDTAAVYGEGSSERILGNFVKSTERESIILSTKFTPQIASDSETAMQDMLDGSKERLHTDRIDIYWIHNPMNVEKWTPYLIPLAKSRQIKFIGVSNHSLAEIAAAWAIAKGTLPIIGVTKVQQVEEAAASARITLTAEEIDRLEKLGEEAGVHTLRKWEKEM